MNSQLEESRNNCDLHSNANSRLIKMAQQIRDSKMDVENKGVGNASIASQEHVKIIQNLSGFKSLSNRSLIPKDNDSGDGESIISRGRREQNIRAAGPMLANGMNYKNFKQVQSNNRVAGYINDSCSHSSADQSGSQSKSISESKSDSKVNSSLMAISKQGNNHSSSKSP